MASCPFLHTTALKCPVSAEEREAWLSDNPQAARNPHTSRAAEQVKTKSFDSVNGVIDGVSKMSVIAGTGVGRSLDEADTRGAITQAADDSNEEDISATQEQNRCPHNPSMGLEKTAREETGAASDTDGQDRRAAAEGEVGISGSDVPKDGRVRAGMCPMGYDSAVFEIGPLSCVLCKALLFDTCRTVPCQHIFCRGCIKRFADCPLCGADIQSLTPDHELQRTVDLFIDGHGRISRPKPSEIKINGKDELAKLDTSVYGGPSLKRGSLLLQHAIRAFQAGNVLSAHSRLEICLADTWQEREREGRGSREIACQLGAVLGSLGDCCRIMGEEEAAAEHFAQSAEQLSSVEDKDAEVMHALSVSLNKLGDLKYYSQDLPGAREQYAKALIVRREASQSAGGASQTLDVAISLAKVADIDRAMGNEEGAFEGFREAAEICKAAAKATDRTSPSLLKKQAATLSFIESQIQ